MKRKIKKQGGFTLIELIVVMVVVAILSAAALPEIAPLFTQSRSAMLTNTKAALYTANASVYAKAAQGGALGATGSVTLNGNTISTAYGFAADLTELKKAMKEISTDYSVTTTTLSDLKAANSATCKMTYTPASSSATPSIFMDTTGC